MTVILGIDPGLRHTGWCVISYNRGMSEYRASGVVAPKATHIADRLHALAKGVADITELHKPDVAAVEETFVNRNPLSSLKLGHARGAIILALAQQCLPVTEYAATTVKKTVVGKGKAEKAQVAAMVATLMPAARGDVETSHDRADAMAIALCHAHHLQWNNLTRGAS